MTRKLTFNIPNSTNRFLEGNGSGYIQAGLPNITGNVSAAITRYSPTGVFVQGDAGGGNVMGTAEASGLQHDVLWFDASHSNSIYGTSSTVQPPACKCYFCIKF